jgi:hypothetical protein
LDSSDLGQLSARRRERIRRYTPGGLRRHTADRDAQVANGWKLRQLPLRSQLRSRPVCAVRERARVRQRTADVDHEAPDVQVNPGGSSISGSATDDLTIRAVRWRDDLGGSGTAELTFRVNADGALHVRDWQMNWRLRAGDVTPRATTVTVVAEDTKGNTSASAVLSLTTPAPAALPKLVEKPPKRLHVPTRIARVRFASSVTEPTLNLVCKLDRRRRRCTTGSATF